MLLRGFPCSVLVMLFMPVFFCAKIGLTDLAPGLDLGLTRVPGLRLTLAICLLSTLPIGDSCFPDTSRRASTSRPESSSFSNERLIGLEDVFALVRSSIGTSRGLSCFVSSLKARAQALAPCPWLSSARPCCLNLIAASIMLHFGVPILDKGVAPGLLEGLGMRVREAVCLSELVAWPS